MVLVYAEGKGLRGFTYFIASIFLSPPVGFIAAAAARPSLTKPFGNVLGKKCSDCAETVRAEARKCRYCGFTFPVPPPGDQS